MKVTRSDETFILFESMPSCCHTTGTEIQTKLLVVHIKCGGVQRRIYLGELLKTLNIQARIASY